MGGRGVLLRFLAKRANQEQIRDQGCVVWALFVFNVKAFSSLFAFDCAKFLQNLASFSPNKSYKRGDNVICEPLGVSICTYIVALQHF